MANVSNSDYYEGLNGIRAIAVISVMLFHFYPSGIFLFGWMGVDLFFVLSGFLITNILLKNKYSNNYFKNFYIRRAIRIFPIYYIVVIPLLVLNIVFKSNDYWGVSSYLFYFQNFTAISRDYLHGLQHTWTLAIEEQFYLFFPFIV